MSPSSGFSLSLDDGYDFLIGESILPRERASVSGVVVTDFLPRGEDRVVCGGGDSDLFRFEIGDVFLVAGESSLHHDLIFSCKTRS